MKKNKYCLIKNDVYPFNIFICIGTDLKFFKNEVFKRFKYKFDKEEDDAIFLNGNGRTIKLKNNQHLIIIRPEKTKIGFDMPTMIHELLHAATSIFDICGIKINADNDEPFAYFMQSLTYKVLSEFDK